MPELPDVEVFRRRIARNALHRRIQAVHAPDDLLLEDISASALKRRLGGHTLESTDRHGKYLFVELGDHAGWLLLHFGMTGDVEILDEDDEEPTYLKLRLDFEDRGRLAYSDRRRLGKIGVVDDVQAYIEEHRLGPDPLEDDVKPDELRERLRGRRTSIKAVLMDQSVLAGLGNIYTDEILFQVGLHPGAPADGLREETVREIHRAIRRVVDTAIKAGADPEKMPEGFLLPHRGKGGECPRCGRELRKETMGGRSAYFCPHDQSRKS